MKWDAGWELTSLTHLNSKSIYQCDKGSREKERTHSRYIEVKLLILFLEMYGKCTAVYKNVRT